MSTHIPSIQESHCGEGTGLSWRPASLTLCKVWSPLPTPWHGTTWLPFDQGKLCILLSSLIFASLSNCNENFWISFWVFGTTWYEKSRLTKKDYKPSLAHRRSCLYYSKICHCLRDKVQWLHLDFRDHLDLGTPCFLVPALRTSPLCTLCFNQKAF
jgi:hypothetical protein